MEYFNTLEMDDPILIEHIRKNLWLPGAPKDRPYVLEYPALKDHSDGQQALFLDVFGVQFLSIWNFCIIKIKYYFNSQPLFTSSAEG